MPVKAVIFGDYMSTKKKKKLRPVGDVLLDWEVILFELTQDHGLQSDEIGALANQWCETHYPASIPEYLDGTRPIRYHGHIEGLKKLAKEIK